jgi:hypothetical protein
MGQVLLTSLAPKGDDPHRQPAQVINCYLRDNGTTRTTRLDQLQWILDNTTPGVFTYLVGDFNFVVDKEDGSMTGKQRLSEKEKGCAGSPSWTP